MSSFDGPGAPIDALFRTIGLATDFSGSGNFGEYLFALSGAAMVLIAGSIWRRRAAGDQAAGSTAQH